MFDELILPGQKPNNQQKQVIEKTLGQKITSIEVVTGGNRSRKPHIKITLYDGRQLLLKKGNSEQLLLLKQIDEMYPTLHLQSIAGVCRFSQDECYALLEWKDGVILGDTNKNRDNSDNSVLVAANALKELHRITRSEEIVRIDDSYIELINSKEYLSKDEKEMITQYISSNLHFLNGRYKSIIHGDLHLQNILLTDSAEIVFIDLDDIRLGDPIEDLVYAANLHGLDNEDYLYYLFLQQYFDMEIPEDFWPIVNIYSIKKAMIIIEDEMRRNQNQKSYLSMSSLFHQHSNMTLDEPLWFRTITEKMIVGASNNAKYER